MLEVAIRFAAKRTEEAWNIANAIRVCFVVIFAVKIIIENILNRCSVFGVFDIMLSFAFLAIAGA
jgi:hypothetical protein